MANEITSQVTLQVNKNGSNTTRASSKQSTMSGNPVAHAVKSVGFAAHEAVTLGSVTSCGWSFLKNLDATNFVTIGIDVAATFYPVLKLKPGEAAVFRFGTNAPYAKADTAAVLLESWINQD